MGNIQITKSISELAAGNGQNNYKKAMEEVAKFYNFFEHSADLIIRFDLKGEFLYVNPVIELYTDHPVEYFKKKHLDQVEIPRELAACLKKLIQDVSESNQRIATEFTMHSDFGNIKIAATAIPENSSEQNLDTILITCREITMIERMKLEIKEKNKKLTDSISYAERIQKAILPGEQSIKSIFSESFLLYKTKDVVSGDFPWLFQNGDEVIIAIADATGHGVPGAILSMIGHYLLEEIVMFHRITEPAMVLNGLHEGVIRSLKQIENPDYCDGLDIALCNINLKKMRLQFSGANRPLLHLHNGEINMIKGDKFGIGGVQYARAGKEVIFSNKIINIERGDSIYIYSDGLADQLGGNDEDNFSNNRIKEIIIQNQHLTLPEQGRILEKNVFEWMNINNAPQTDDMIMIGIRL
ncbi:MAG: SpoIIE family protein phosphatase [Bacteroidetes bacterium]|nr:SpoIIE family protein phosphatase [Bacteroidota bacterium]